MTKILLSVLSTLALTSVAPAFAQSEVNGPLYTCYLTGQMKGATVAILFGGQYIKGPGQLTCVDAKSNRQMVYPVNLKLVGFGPGLEITEVRSMQIVSGGIGVNDPGLFAESFSLGATAGATLIKAGLAFDVAVRANAHNGFGFELGLQGNDVVGLGAHLFGMTFTIEPRK